MPANEIDMTLSLLYYGVIQGLAVARKPARDGKTTNRSCQFKLHSFFQSDTVQGWGERCCSEGKAHLQASLARVSQFCDQHWIDNNSAGEDNKDNICLSELVEKFRAGVNTVTVGVEAEPRYSMLSKL